MTMENSPRAIRAVPARTRPGRAMPARRAAHQPVPTLVAAVTTASTPATAATGRRSPGSIWSPKNKKKVAAKRSRSGLTRRLARSWALPPRAMPTRKAPTAAETWSWAATPATSRVRPSTPSRRASSERLSTARLTTGPWRRATNRTTATAARAAVTETTPATRDPPASSTATTGRYTAMARSSMTSTDSTEGVSRLPRRSRSRSTLEMTPEEEM